VLHELREGLIEDEPGALVGPSSRRVVLHVCQVQIRDDEIAIPHLLPSTVLFASR